MDEEFGYGPRWAWNTTCCGKPVGCTNMSDQCLMKNHPWKRRNNVPDLAGFITARLDEDEAAARHAGPGIVAWLSVHDDAGDFRYTTVAATSGDSDDVWCADGRALPEPASVRVIYDPARMLREVAFMRAVLDRHMPHETAFGGFACDWCSEDVDDRPQLAKERWPCPDVRNLAAVWNGHPGYRQEWAVRPGPG